jgi:hypothetical protein
VGLQLVGSSPLSDLEARLQSIGPDPFMVDLQRFGTHLPDSVAAGLVGAAIGAAPDGEDQAARHLQGAWA